jgi:dephospho-CoA kinase
MPQMRIPQERIDELNSSLVMLGVTGSMGCGKSYACDRLESLAAEAGIGFTHIDVDTIRRDILSANPDYTTLRTTIANILSNPESPQSILNEDGSISTARLNSMIYSSDAAMEKFKEMLIPGLLSYINDELQGKTGVAAIDWALLAEDNLLPFVQYNALLVTCDKETQMARLKGGDLPKQEIYRRISLQLTNSEKEMCIKNAQIMADMGQLYKFDTSGNPADYEYSALFEKVALTIDKENTQNRKMQEQYTHHLDRWD